MTERPEVSDSCGRSDPALVVFRDVEVRLAGRRVLEPFSWALRPGEHWAVFGANGSGKTTLLRLIAGELWPHPGRGTRRYDFGAGAERDALNARARIRLVTPELQDRYCRYRWNPEGSVLVATGFADSPILRMTPDRPQRGAMRDVIERLGLADLTGRRFLELSCGEQRRLLLGRALVAKPRVLLLDEVCDGLDQQNRALILSVLDEFAREGLQLVFATHRPEELPESLNRSMVLKQGRMTADTGVAHNAWRPARRVTRPPARRADGMARESVAANAPLIAIRNADIYRGQARVICGLSWHLDQTQNWLIRGANGSGKSTLIKLLYGDLRPAVSGRVQWFDLPCPVNVWELRRRLGLVSDELQSIYGDSVTVHDCVATGFAASIGRVPRLTMGQRAEIDRWVHELQLHEWRDTRIPQLSYGQFRRVLVARAMVQRPRALLLDEPQSGLDAASCDRLWSLLHRLSDAGTRLVMATHEQIPRDGLFARELVLSAGRAEARFVD